MLRCSNFVHIKCLCFCGAPPPPAALAVARPQPPCVSTYGLGRGADLASGVRFLAHGVACCGVCRRCDKPPAPSALPPGVGRSRGLLNVGVLHSGASRAAVSFMRLPTRTSTPKSSPRSPPNLGGSAEGAGGVPSHSAKPTRCAKHWPCSKSPPWAANRAPDAKSAPLPRP